MEPPAMARALFSFLLLDFAGAAALEAGAGWVVAGVESSVCDEDCGKEIWIVVGPLDPEDVARGNLCFFVRCLRLGIGED